MDPTTVTTPDQAPAIPVKDLIFELRFFRSHYLLASFRRGKLGDETWVCLGGDYIRLPDNYGALLLGNDEPPRIHDLGDEFRHPRLYAAETEWLGYVPDAIAWYLDNPEDDVLWVYQYYSDIDHLLEDDNDEQRISGDLINEIIDDLKEAREIVCRLEERGGLPLTMVDSGYRPRWLRDCRGETACRYGLYKARTCLLNLLGAISWGLCHVDDYTKGLITQTRVAKLRRWLVTLAPKLGFVLDPRRPGLDEFPLLELLDNECPVYYPWSYQWRPEQSDADLDALAGVGIGNFAMVVERAGRSKSPLLEAVRTGPPAFPGALLESCISMEEPSPPASRSPVKDYEKREFALRDLQERLEEALGHEFTHSRPTHVLWTYADERNLPKDTILEISPLTEARMRLWSLWTRLSSPADVVLQAIARGMRVRLVYRMDTKTAIKAYQEHEPSTPPIPPRPLSGSHVGYWETWGEFLALAKRLLSQPDAAAYLMLGGIVARIAVWLGPPDLVAKLVQGPSSHAGLRVTDLHPTQNYLCDAADPENVRALSGIVEDPNDGTIRSWFPTQENLEYCGFWRGEWTHEHELWFLTRVENIRERKENTKPMTAHQWSAQLKRRRVRWLDRHVPDEREVQRIVDDLATETGGRWNGATLEEMMGRFGFD